MSGHTSESTEGQRLDWSDFDAAVVGEVYAGAGEMTIASVVAVAAVETKVNSFNEICSTRDSLNSQLHL